MKKLVVCSLFVLGMIGCKGAAVDRCVSNSSFAYECQAQMAPSEDQVATYETSCSNAFDDAKEKGCLGEGDDYQSCLEDLADGGSEQCVNLASCNELGVVYQTCLGAATMTEEEDLADEEGEDLSGEEENING